MKITIITVCYNSGNTIARTIESVLAQDYDDIEYLIVDGVSSDNTVAIADSYRARFSEKGISYVVKSEPDEGIYDAMNKGVVAASGDIIGILNSDDCYAWHDILSTVAQAFEENRTDTLYGNLLYVKDEKPYRYWRSGKFRTFKYGWMPPHPAFFATKEAYAKYGLYRTDCGVNADYELMLRFLEKSKATTCWIDKVFVNMSAGGISNDGINSRIVAFHNDALAWEKNGLRPCKLSIFLKKLRKIPQFMGARMFLKESTLIYIICP